MKNSLDKILLIAAVIVAGVIVYLSTGLSQVQVSEELKNQAPGGERFQPQVQRVEAPKPEIWNQPDEQTDGWIFEVFTPPKIYFNEKSTEFVVELPTEGTLVRQATPFGLDLLEIRRDVYRVQLAGYSGDFGTFRVDDSRVVRGRPGKEFEDEKFRILSLEEERNVEEPEEGGTPIITRRGVAKINDLTNQHDYILRSDEVTLADFPVAEVELRTKTENARKVMVQGEVWKTKEAEYTVNTIDEEKGSIVVTKKSFGEEAETETKTLTASGYFDLSSPKKQQFKELLEELPGSDSTGAQGNDFFDPAATD